MNSMTGEQSICFEKPPYLFVRPLWQAKKKEKGRLEKKST